MAYARTLVLDGQLFQTNAYFRGMGGYVFGLTRAYITTNPDTRLVIVLNKHMEHGQERLDGIKRWLPDAELHLLDLPYEPKPGHEEARAVQELDRFIAQEVTTGPENTFYFIPALFLFQYCAEFPHNVRKLLLFHDLMPLMYREELGKYFPNHLYFPRFKTIMEADVVFTNSQTTANDLQQYIGIDPKHLVNIDGSLNEQLVHNDQVTGEERGILDRLNLRDKQYILMPTGGLENKNNIRAAQAFEVVRDRTGQDMQLVVTSNFEEQARKELEIVAGDHITFTGNIQNEELLPLYEHAAVVLMPSLYEGLGLPVLEGVAHNKPVACSDIPVFCELPHAKEALYTFDPYSVEAIADALQTALAADDLEQRRKHYPAILEKYSWPRSATLFAEALTNNNYFVDRAKPTRRIAVTCPDPRKNTDVAVLAQRLYGYGQQHGVEFVYFIDPGELEEIEDAPHPDYVRALALCYDIQDIYTVLPTLQVQTIVHFLSDDTRFQQLLRAALTVPGFACISHAGYRPTVERLAELQMISSEQAAAETMLYEQAREQHVFETPSILTNAQGVIATKDQQQNVQAALRWAGLDLPVVAIPDAVNDGGDVLAKQADAYKQIIEFMTKEV